MKKKLLIISVLAFLFVCLFALSVSAEVDYTKKVTLNDGTELPLFDENNQSLVWFVLGTDDSGKKEYASVSVNNNSADNATSYITFNINSMYGEKQMHDIYIKYWDSENGAYVSYNHSSIVVFNLMTFEGEYWAVNGSKFSSQNLEYLLHSSTVRDAGDFTGFSNLQVVDCSLATDYKSFSEQAFKGCTSLREFHFGSGEYGLTCQNSNLFNGCTSLSTLIFAEGTKITSICGSAFINCKSLTGAYEFPYVTKLSDKAFNNCGTNEDTYLTLSFPALTTLGDGSWDTHVFSDSGVAEIYIGDDISFMGINCFTRCKRLWKIEFAGFGEGFSFKSYTFEDCSALLAFSIPEGITELPNRMFKGCTSLKAVYLPSTLTAINAGSQDHSTFAKCTNLYFVSQPFTFTGENDIPAKEDIYYFPKNLTTLSGETFKQCPSLNKTLVFGTGVTSIGNSWAFEAGVNNPTLENIVFLGDMQTVSASSWKLTGKVYFANSADISSESVAISGLSGKTVFCFGEGNTEHLCEKTLATEANCFYPKMVASYCFCGSIFGEPVTEGEALGHDYMGVGSVDLGIFYENYFASGVHKHLCSRCDNVGEESVSAIFEWMGYSKSTFGDSYAVVQGFKINRETLAQYKVYAFDFDFGIMATGNANGEAIMPQIGDEKVFTAIFDNTVNDYYDIKVTGITEELMDKNIVFCIYVTDGGKMYYLDGENTGESVTGISYNNIPALGN